MPLRHETTCFLFVGSANLEEETASFRAFYISFSMSARYIFITGYPRELQKDNELYDTFNKPLPESEVRQQFESYVLPPARRFPSSTKDKRQTEADLQVGFFI